MIEGSVVCRISYGPSGGFYCDYCKTEFGNRHELPCDVELTPAPIEWANPGETVDEVKEARIKKIEKWPKKRK